MALDGLEGSVGKWGACSANERGKAPNVFRSRTYILRSALQAEPGRPCFGKLVRKSALTWRRAEGVRVFGNHPLAHAPLLGRQPQNVYSSRLTMLTASRFKMLACRSPAFCCPAGGKVSGRSRSGITQTSCTEKHMQEALASMLKLR